jgi:hypothetical protein
LIVDFVIGNFSLCFFFIARFCLNRGNSHGLRLHFGGIVDIPKTLMSQFRLWFPMFFKKLRFIATLQSARVCVLIYGCHWILEDN